MWTNTITRTWAVTDLKRIWSLKLGFHSETLTLSPHRVITFFLEIVCGITYYFSHTVTLIENVKQFHNGILTRLISPVICFWSDRTQTTVIFIVWLYFEIKSWVCANFVIYFPLVCHIPYVFTLSSPRLSPEWFMRTGKNFILHNRSTWKSCISVEYVTVTRQR